MNKNVLLILLIGIFAIGGFALFGPQGKNKKETAPVIQVPVATKVPISVDYTAGFAIFTNGTFRVFTASMYHNLSKDVFISSDNPNLVHVKKPNVTWDDFFKTLPFKLTKDCLTTGTGQTFCSRSASISDAQDKSSGQAELRFYLNGKEDPSVLDKQINAGDKLLVTYGSESDQQIQTQLQQISN